MKHFLLLLAATLLFAADNSAHFTPKKVAELKSLPTDGAETVEMLQTGVKLSIRSRLTDTLGRDWFMVQMVGSNKGGFTLASELEPLETESDTVGSPKLKKEVAADKKRRLTLVRNNPGWSRRVKSAIHNGTICLSMTREQLLACWESPDAETDGFILGAGDVHILFYRKGDPIAVILKNNEVIGWSEKKR